MKKLTILLIVSAAILSCKKDKNKDSCSTDVASVSGSYKITAYTYKASSSSPEQDYFNVAFPDACERDDILTLNANGNYTLTDAGVVCSPAGDDTGTWSLSGNTFSIDGDASTVESFNCKNLVVSTADAFIQGDKVKITLTKQ